MKTTDDELAKLIRHGDNEGIVRMWCAAKRVGAVSGDVQDAAEAAVQRVGRGAGGDAIDDGLDYYDSRAEAIEAYRENLADTLMDWGYDYALDDWALRNIADAAYCEVTRSAVEVI